MTASVNLVLLIGRLARDPELRFTPQGVAICRLRLMTETVEPHGAGPGGDRQSRQQYHRIVLEGPMAEAPGASLRQGDGLLVLGRLRTRHWKDRSSAGPARTARPRAHVEVLASQVQCLTVPVPAPGAVEPDLFCGFDARGPGQQTGDDPQQPGGARAGGSLVDSVDRIRTSRHPGGQGTGTPGTG